MTTSRAEYIKYELYLKENIIKKLKEKGYKHNTDITIDNYEDKKFFAFKTLDCTEEQLNNGVKMASNTLRNFLAEIQYEHIDFNIVKIESLTDRDDFSELWRGILVAKPSKKVEEKIHITNYEKIKNMTVDEMARFLEDKISLPFEIAIQNKRSRLNYIKRWLQQESEG